MYIMFLLLTVSVLSEYFLFENMLYKFSILYLPVITNWFIKYKT